MDSTVIVEHLKEYAVFYGGGVVVLVPLIIVFRKWALPLLFFILETIIYLVSMHVVIGGIVRVGAWFKGETSMSALGERQAAPNWTTPLNFNFWDKTQYVPEQVFYFECALVLVIIIAVFKFRPLNYKKRKKRKGEIVDPKRAEEIRRARQAAGRDGYHE